MAQVAAGIGHHRDHGVLYSVDVPYPPSGEALGEGGVDVVLSDDLQKGVSGHPGQAGRPVGTYQEGREEELLDVDEGILEEGSHTPYRRDPAKGRGKEDDGDGGQPELWSGRPQYSQEAGNLVRRPVLVGGGK